MSFAIAGNRTAVLWKRSSRLLRLELKGAQMIRVVVIRLAFSVLFCVSVGPAVATAADGWFAPPPRTSAQPPQRGVLGLPIPQQWTGRPRSAPCPGGNCPQPGIATNCPNGRCPQPQPLPLEPKPAVTRRKAPVTAPVPGVSRAKEHTQPADPFRPVTAPLRDAFGSSYDREQLDLRSDYFRRNNGELSQPKAGPGGRSMEVPVELPSGTARI